MPVLDVREDYDECFAPPPSIEGPEDIDAANRAGISELNLKGPPEMGWKGGFESRWLRNQTIQLQPETAEWNGVQLPRTAMWSLKAVSLPVPRTFEHSGAFIALDVAAWNNNEVQYLPGNKTTPPD
jgi:hypothetical protein